MENKNFDKILSNIPDYFYPAFAGELVSVFGIEILEPSETGEVPLFYISGTTGWNAALRMTCKKLGIDWLMSWYDELEWFDSDNFDGELVEMMETKFLDNSSESNNSYYRWVIDHIGSDEA